MFGIPLKDCTSPSSIRQIEGDCLVESREQRLVQILPPVCSADDNRALLFSKSFKLPQQDGEKASGSLMDPIRRVAVRRERIYLIDEDYALSKLLAS